MSLLADQVKARSRKRSPQQPIAPEQRVGPWARARAEHEVAVYAQDGLNKASLYSCSFISHLKSKDITAARYNGRRGGERADEAESLQIEADHSLVSA